MKTKIHVSAITCNGTSEIGHDEVYLIYQADGRAPFRYPVKNSDYQSMAKGDTWSFTDDELNLEFTHELLITLWDRDTAGLPNLATFLVSFDITPDTLQPVLAEANPNGAAYELGFTRPAA